MWLFRAWKRKKQKTFFLQFWECFHSHKKCQLHTHSNPESGDGPQKPKTRFLRDSFSESGPKTTLDIFRAPAVMTAPRQIPEKHCNFSARKLRAPIFERKPISVIERKNPEKKTQNTPNFVFFVFFVSLSLSLYFSSGLCSSSLTLSLSLFLSSFSSLSLYLSICSHLFSPPLLSLLVALLLLLLYCPSLSRSPISISASVSSSMLSLSLSIHLPWWPSHSLSHNISQYLSLSLSMSHLRSVIDDRPSLSLSLLLFPPSLLCPQLLCCPSPSVYRKQAAYGFVEHSFKHWALWVFGPHWAPGRELSEFLSVYFLCAKSELTKFFAELTGFAAELSEFCLSSETVLSKQYSVRFPVESFYRCTCLPRCLQRQLLKEIGDDIGVDFAGMASEETPTLRCIHYDDPELSLSDRDEDSAPPAPLCVGTPVRVVGLDTSEATSCFNGAKAWRE